MKRFVQWLVVIAFVFSCTGCASLGRKLKAWVGGRPDGDVAATPAEDPSSRTPSFSGQGNLTPAKERRYKRVTAENFSDDQMLEDNAGSLWRKEGQGSYLFSQNNLRQLGDIINVEIEGKAASNLGSKLAMIKAYLARTEPQPVVRQPAMAPRPEAGPQVPSPERKPDGTTGVAQAGPGAPGAQGALPPGFLPLEQNQNDQARLEKEREEERLKAELSKFDDVPCRIVDKNADGSYRVKGQTSIYVGRHEYRLIVTGLVRNEDINSEVVGSTRVLDGKYDLVSTVKEIKHD